MYFLLFLEQMQIYERAMRRHDTQPNDTQSNDIQRNAVRHNGIQSDDVQHNKICNNRLDWDTQHLVSITALSMEYCYTVCVLYVRMNVSIC